VRRRRRDVVATIEDRKTFFSTRRYNGASPAHFFFSRSLSFESRSLQRTRHSPPVDSVTLKINKGFTLPVALFLLLLFLLLLLLLLILLIFLLLFLLHATALRSFARSRSLASYPMSQERQQRGSTGRGSYGGWTTRRSIKRRCDARRLATPKFTRPQPMIPSYKKIFLSLREREKIQESKNNIIL